VLQLYAFSLVPRVNRRSHLLYTWLPDAMAGPTPVSALIHAATMVTAGIFMITRMNFVFDLTPEVQNIIAIVGAATALVAASIGLLQNDIQKGIGLFYRFHNWD